ncbi:MAG TPA: hypothetical protein VFG42_16235 [Baekduia sp.]|uniref:hypothetical protein n=1 Tax=Baekduia sp. TaxID=2600305 RepID=UPI002D780D81|nr:hypothetical protein [Baekduia sp.]HET6508343.1 hypothetical protein [Baekduia sp.]
MVVLADSTRLAPPVVAPADERAARRTLRAQIARLERELGAAVLAAFPHVTDADVQARAAAVHGPRLLGLGELERVRDELAERVRRAHVVVARRAELEADSRALLEEMLRDPARHRHVRLPLADLGEHGCGAYLVRPRLGIVGRCMGWWQVKLSSGCPRPAPA